MQRSFPAKEVILTLKVGEGGRTFGSVSSKEISEAAKKQLNLDIDKKKLQLENPIRNLGVTNVPVRLHPKVTAKSQSLGKRGVINGRSTDQEDSTSQY